MRIYCKVCGKVLRDPVSIARGMGPRCAGVTGSGKSFHASLSRQTGNTCPAILTSLDMLRDPVPETLMKFPTDLVELVLTAPSAGSIAERVKLHRQINHASDTHPVKALKQIRRMCIEFRLLFWPGLFTSREPLPCIPYGENDWKIGEDGRVCSKDELVSYLSRYGIISSQLQE